MAWQDLLAALALMLVLEGILPFLNPKRYRNLLKMLDEMDDATVRRIGFISMLLGLGLLYLVR
ncbi:MAG: DUF2065 domain-containing protein [Gammaproteobacteria bacterium]|nr:MAG: DUF2065 domain-containing protein [Gammaproteobacteria bacterium]RTZ76213.1 MAG: DUF2065 domain-containing protein [Gammaproteobacteria bacterium]RTZ81129.1 MAG: DUF2065 domain-containing protein [Gammaproteobacteria bacterium]